MKNKALFISILMLTATLAFAGPITNYTSKTKALADRLVEFQCEFKKCPGPGWMISTNRIGPPYSHRCSVCKKTRLLPVAYPYHIPRKP